MSAQNGDSLKQNKQANKQTKNHTLMPPSSSMSASVGLCHFLGRSEGGLMAQIPCSPPCQKEICNPSQYTVPDPSDQAWTSGCRKRVQGVRWGLNLWLVLKLTKIWIFSAPPVHIKILSPRSPMCPLASAHVTDYTGPPNPELLHLETHWVL